MTVKELIDTLSDFPEDMDVLFAYNYGDYWRTTVADKIEKVEEGEVTYSDYHNRYAVVNDENSDEEDDKVKSVVILF